MDNSQFFQPLLFSLTPERPDGGGLPTPRSVTRAGPESSFSRRSGNTPTSVHTESTPPPPPPPVLRLTEDVMMGWCACLTDYSLFLLGGTCFEVVKCLHCRGPQHGTQYSSKPHAALASSTFSSPHKLLGPQHGCLTPSALSNGSHGARNAIRGCVGHRLRVHTG